MTKMASQQLQAEIAAHGGECYEGECFQFGFEVKTDEERRQVDEFAHRYSDILEVDPETTETTKVFRIRETELAQKPKELAGTIFEYLPETEIAKHFAGHKQLEEAKEYAIARLEVIEMTVESKHLVGTEFYAWLGTHRHLKSLKLTFEIDEPENEEEEMPATPLIELMETIGKLDDLETLELTYLPFGWNPEALAAALMNLPLLTTLKISGRGIDDAKMTILAPSLNQLTRLDSLDIGGLDLTAESLKLLIPTFERLTHLNADSTSGDADWEQIFPLMTNVKRLTHVNFYASALSGQTLAGFLSHLPNLVELNLGECEIDVGFYLLKPVLQSLTKIEYLNVAENELGYDEYLELLDIYGGYPNLKKFDIAIRLSKFGNDKLPELLRHYAAMFARTLHLETVNLVDLALDQRALEILAPALSYLPLKDLTLSLDAITDGTMLGNLFDHLPGLTSVALTFSRGFTLYDQLFESLQHCSSLEMLHLQDLMILSPVLATLLKSLPHLHRLAFEDTEFDLVSFFDQMGPLLGLTHLVLTMRKLQRVFNRLVPLLVGFTNLEELDIKYSSVLGPNDHLTTLVGGLPRLTKLSLSYSKNIPLLKKILREINPELRIIA